MPDPIVVVASVLAPYWWLPLMLVLGALLQTPAFKGWTGEIVLHLSLRLLLDRKRYHLFRNVTLPTADGSTQIDHIVVSRHGIFVIETKNYGGWIFGKPHDKKWTQKFPRRSSAFQNPVRQNYKHLRTLADLLALGDDVLFSLVVFVGSAEFKTTMPENVTKLGGCIGFIRRHSAPLLGEAQVAEAIARIAAGACEACAGAGGCQAAGRARAAAGRGARCGGLPAVWGDSASIYLQNRGQGGIVVRGV